MTYRWNQRLYSPFCCYVRDILNCQSASLVNSSAQQPCWRPPGPTNRCEPRARARRSSEGSWRWLKSDANLSLHPLTDQLIGKEGRNEPMRSTVRDAGSAQLQLKWQPLWRAYNWATGATNAKHVHCWALMKRYPTTNRLPMYAHTHKRKKGLYCVSKL